MAIRSSSINKDVIQSKPKRTRQGMGKNTKYSASSSNSARKRYRGQGR